MDVINDLPGLLALPAAGRAPLDLAFGAGKTRLLVPRSRVGAVGLMTPCTSERPEVSIQHRRFTLDGKDTDVVTIALSLPEDLQSALGDLQVGEVLLAKGLHVKRTR